LANCSAKFDLSNKVLNLYFQDTIQGLNQATALYPVEKFFCFSTVLVDSFTHANEDSWDITTFNYVKEYELKIHFPPGKKIEKVTIYRKVEETEIRVNAASPIVISKPDRQSLYLLITGFDQRDKFVIRWSYKK
jgi:hypothetical protein